jgi:hypothetical protein
MRRFLLVSAVVLLIKTGSAYGDYTKLFEQWEWEIDAGVAVTHIIPVNLDFERGNYPGHDPAPDGGVHKVALPFTDEHFTMQRTYLGFTLIPVPLEWLSFNFKMSQGRTWGSPYWKTPMTLRDIAREIASQMFPHIIMPYTRLDAIVFPGIPPIIIDGVLIGGTKAYKHYTDELIVIVLPPGIPVDPITIPAKELLTGARPVFVEKLAGAIYDGFVAAGIRKPTDPRVPDTLWEDIDSAYFAVNFSDFEASIGRQPLIIGLPVDRNVVTDLIGIGIVEDLLDMVIGHADAAVFSHRTPPIMGLVSPRVEAFGLKLDDADPAVCRIRSDHYLRGASVSLELSAAEVLGALGLEFELPPGVKEVDIDILSVSRVIREDQDLVDRVQSDILRLPIAAYVRQSGRVGLWETAPDPVTGVVKPWRHYTDGPRHWVGSEEVGGYAWVGMVPVVIPGEHMPFFAAIHEYRSGDDPATPNVDEAFDPVPYDIFFMPLDPAAILPIDMASLPEGLDIGTNMRYQLYVAGFMPGEGPMMGGFYAELDRARVERRRDLFGNELGRDKDFLQMAGLFSVFTGGDVSLTLAGIEVRPEDAAFDALQEFVTDAHIDARLWAPGSPMPEPLVRSREWIRIFTGMITLTPTENTSLTIGGAWIDPADHLVNILNAIFYYDGEKEVEALLAAHGLPTELTMHPFERFAKPFMDEPVMICFMQFGIHF